MSIIRKDVKEYMEKAKVIMGDGKRITKQQQTKLEEIGFWKSIFKYNKDGNLIELMKEHDILGSDFIKCGNMLLTIYKDEEEKRDYEA